MNALGLLLAALSIWEYPALQPKHEQCKERFVAAVRKRDAMAMEQACAAAVKTFPEDPTWRYNLACSLAVGGRRDRALDTLEKAIDLGLCNVELIRNDKDFKSVRDTPRFRELLEYADVSRGKMRFSGPCCGVPVYTPVGTNATIDAHNLNWDFDAGLFTADLRLTPSGPATGNAGDLYVNRDRGHSMLRLADFPGITWVRLGAAAKPYKLDTDLPIVRFPRPGEAGPHPVFGNVSRALVTGPYWRSHPRALVTTQAHRLNAMALLYVSNQTWVFPACDDVTPGGRYGDVFASVTPYCLATQGRSWSDQYYLRAALEASRSFKPEVKREIVRQGLLAPTIQAILRKSLRTVKADGDYLTAKAHPTALPPGGLDLVKVKRLAAETAADGIPPLAVVQVGMTPPQKMPDFPEVTYATPFASAFVLRAPDATRQFEIRAKLPQKATFAFAVTHDDRGAATLRAVGPAKATLTLDRAKMSPTNRVDVAVFAKSEKSGWGAPSYVCFAVVDPSAPYSDPVLTPQPPKKTEPAGPTHLVFKGQDGDDSLGRRP